MPPLLDAEPPLDDEPPLDVDPNPPLLDSVPPLDVAPDPPPVEPEAPLEDAIPPLLPPEPPVEDVPAPPLDDEPAVESVEGGVGALLLAVGTVELRPPTPNRKEGSKDRDCLDCIHRWRPARAVGAPERALPPQWF